MPLTEFDETAALIVIDLQNGISGFPTAHPIKDIAGRSAELARAFRERGSPVILVNVTGRAPGRADAGFPNFPKADDWAVLLEELGQTPQDYVVSKERWGAFIGTDLDQYLRSRGVTQVFMTGVATSAGVESTARSAHDHGYNVVFVEDAMTDMNENAHRHSLEYIFPRMGQVDTTTKVLQLLGSHSAKTAIAK